MQEKVYCPLCNKRIFSLTLRGKAYIEIKCPRCKNVVTIKRADEA